MESEIYRNILIATDGSKLSEHTIKYGVELAKLGGSKLYAAYVVDTADFASIPMESDAGWETMYSLLKEEGKQATQNVEDIAERAGVDVEQVLLEGHPAHEIIEFSSKNDIDIIVMGTHGKSGLNRFILGSVAEKVIRSSKIPVFVVPAEEDSENE